MKSQRFWLPAAMVLAAFIGGGLVNVGFAAKKPNPPTVMTVRELHVVDESGKTRIALDMFQGLPSIRLLDADGRRRVHLFSGGQEECVNEMAGVHIVSNDEHTWIRLGLEHYACPTMQMHYKGGDSLVGVGVNPDGSPHIWLRDKDQKIVFQAP